MSVSLPATTALHGVGQDHGAGQRLGGRYRLQALLADGDRASTWQAVDERSGRPVLAWALPPGVPVPVEVTAAVLTSAVPMDRRFARITDADCAGGEPYIVGQWPGGRRLEDLLGAGLPDPALAAAIAADVTDAVVTAHAAGRAHLALSPRTVFWTGRQAVITGLGIEAALTTPALLTLPAVEQAAIDARALAGLLYALLTGCWPGTARSALPPATDTGGVACPPRDLHPDLPWALDLVAECALAPQRDPATLSPARFATELRTARRACDRPRHRNRRAVHWPSGL